MNEPYQIAGPCDTEAVSDFLVKEGQIESLLHLDLTSNQISDLEPLGDLTELAILKSGDNRIQDISNARSIRTTSRRTDIASRPQGSSSHRTDTLSRTRAPTAPSVDSDQAAFGSHPC